jgi:hypothetical protein
MSFLRHEEIYRSDVSPATAGSGNSWSPLQRSSAAMSFQSAIPWRVALRQSLPPLHRLVTILNKSTLPYNDFSANGNYPLNFVSQSKGALHFSLDILFHRMSVMA